MNDHAALRIAIIGAGPAGLAAGHELLARGFDDFTIFEATDAVGGTWHIHSYPGLACDVWAHSYTFSYRPNPDWSASFAEQPEIEAYLQQCAREFGLEPHLRLNTRIARAEYQDDGTWHLASEAGETFPCDVVINAMGNQHTPKYPDVPGLDRFEGDSWHATRWNHDVPLEGKRVVVVGSAASAVQIVPELAKVAGHLTVLQRSANWIMPRGRKPYSDAQRRWFRRVPALIGGIRRFQRLLMSFVIDGVSLGHKRMDDFEARAKGFIEKSIPDPALRKALTPDSRFGCKRGLVSDGFYPALTQDHVELVAEGLAEVRPRGITTASGREIDCDVIVYCTGYRIQDFDRIDVVGEAGLSLAKAMAEAPESHKGIARPGFPNYFFAVGPNGVVLNVSYFITAERNVRSIVRLLEQKQQAGARAIAVDPAVHRAYNDWLRERIPRFSWGAPSCTSYYQDAQGRAPFLFPGTFAEYDALHEEGGLHEYEVRV